MRYDQSQHSARMLLQKDSWAVDYQATRNVLEVAREKGARHFVLLSAICVQKPLLEFQHAKLKLEAALQSAGDITYSIVRPTAFFKSLAGQVRCFAAMFLCRTTCCVQPMSCLVWQLKQLFHMAVPAERLKHSAQRWQGLLGQSKGLSQTAMLLSGDAAPGRGNAAHALLL